MEAFCFSVMEEAYRRNMCKACMKNEKKVNFAAAQQVRCPAGNSTPGLLFIPLPRTPLRGKGQ